ncbi:hypothetical protein FEE95_06205 [Maribacter algarum]|uniref:Uncharacterized protein n=1 Tax=Maribacter algarum (ex Zhang et al. 2020) TaxID=2578118 RepID=A0A5S3PVN6_9FLAO|nr:hypothetical protein [Maribacter algarum]TMM59023.1 hypothetical protein FEE95_06205 [Maribacter algarum]
MNKGVNFLAAIFLIGILISCKKDDVSENCYVCSNEIESIDVCEENGNFVVDGEVIPNENGASLEDLVRAVEANPDNNPNLEGVTCRRK